jgi:competence protein ComEA
MSPIEGRSVARGGILLLVLSVIRFGVEGGGASGPLLEEEGDDLPRLLEETREAREEVSRRAKPLGTGERLDPNRSLEEDLDRLPGVGPVVAEALIRERMENGGFSRPGDLLRVPGIGPATLRRIEPYLDFSDGIPLDLRRFARESQESQRGEGSPRSENDSGGFEEAISPPKVNLNRASLQELQALPGIGPVLAERVLRSRSEDGPFRVPEDLLRVQGIGPATLARIKSWVFVGG